MDSALRITAGCTLSSIDESWLKLSTGDLLLRGTAKRKIHRKLTQDTMQDAQPVACNWHCWQLADPARAHARRRRHCCSRSVMGGTRKPKLSGSTKNKKPPRKPNAASGSAQRATGTTKLSSYLAMALLSHLLCMSQENYAQIYQAATMPATNSTSGLMASKA